MEASPAIQFILGNISKRRAMTEGMRAIRQRASEFASPLQAKLTGIALDPNARFFADSLLDEFWDGRVSGSFRRDRARRGEYREIIIGSGFHAAVYAATRVLSGYPKPLVLERSSRAGGTFAMSPRPVFYLNSRNRAGELGLAGDNGASLNYLPGAPIQASNISADEYQSNAEMAFVIRLTLAQYADVLTRMDVNEIYASSTPDSINIIAVYASSTPRDARFDTGRVIDARGLGDPVSTDDANGSTILTFPQFMQRMTGMWPLRGIRRAAVIGNGDSARCAVESLLGIAPGALMSAAALDQVERVDWYGQYLARDCNDWRETERGRYQRIGRFLRSDRFGNRRLNVFNMRPEPTALPGKRVIVNDRSYDLVITATGSRTNAITGLNPEDFVAYNVGGTPVARRNMYGAGLQNVFSIGPTAQLPFSEQERRNGVADVEANAVSMFRLATKTALLAASTLDGAR